MLVSELKSDIDFMCGTTSATYSNTDKLRNMNIAYQNVAKIIWESAGTWQYDDSNATDFGIATRALVAGQQDYDLPATCQRLERVEVLDGNGNYIPLEQKDIHDIKVGATEYLSGGGTPMFYDIIGNSVFLYPYPATGYVTLAAGLKIWFSRDVTALDSDADTPGFALPFHRLLSLNAAIDFSRDPGDIQKWTTQKVILENSMRSFYSKRNVDKNIRLKPAGKNRWRKYT